MNLKNTLCVCISSLMSHKTKFFMATIMIGLSMLGIGYFTIFSNESNYIDDECNKVLTRGVAGTGVMIVSEYNSYEAKKLKEEAMKSGKVKCIGTWLSGDYWAIIDELVLEKNRKARGGMPRIGWVNIDRSAMGILNLEFTKKLDVPEEKWATPGWKGLYLGWDYHDIPLGTTYRYVSSDQKTEITYEVVGILKKGQEALDDSVISSGMGNGLFSIECWDDVVVCPDEIYDNSFETNYLAYIPQDNISLNEATDYLKTKANDLNLKVRFLSLEEGFYLGRINQVDRHGIERRMIIMLCIVCLLVNACFLLAQLISEKKEMGIYFACGFSYTDIFKIYFWQCLFKIFIAFCMGCIGLHKICVLFFRHFDFGRQGLSLCYRWMYHKAFPQMAGFGIVLLSVFTIIQICSVWNAIPAELIKDPRG